jgi:hypothetical protein
MKPLRITRSNALAGTAALALLVALWLDAPEDTALRSGKTQPRAGPGPTLAPTSQAASVVTLRAVDLLGAAAMAAPAAGPQPAPRRAETPPAYDRTAALAALDTRLIAQRVAPAAAAANALAVKSWFVAPPAPPPAPEAAPPAPPPPQAPPLPFKYMGSIQESAERTVWYLMQGERLIVAGVGDVIDSTYRTEGAEGGQLRFTYLPLNQRQVLAIGVPP